MTTGERRIDVRALHKPLMDAGIVPKNCRLMTLRVGTSGGLVVVYEVFITVDQLATLGRVFETVSDAMKQDGPDARRAPADLTPGCDCGEMGQIDPAYHASDCTWRMRTGR